MVKSALFKPNLTAGGQSGVPSEVQSQGLSWGRSAIQGLHPDHARAHRLSPTPAPCTFCCVPATDATREI